MTTKLEGIPLNRALNLRALACAALATLASTSFAAGYSVVEPAVKPIFPQGDHTDSQPTALAADGRMLIIATTSKGNTYRHGGETCSAAGDFCKRLEPKDRPSFYSAASSDFKHFAGFAEDLAGGQQWVTRLNGGVPEYLFQGAVATSINKRNVVVGADFAGQAFRYGDKKETLPALGWPESSANWINDSGVCVGRGESADDSRALIWNRLGEVRPLQPSMPDGMGHYSAASFISADGVAYGTSTYHDRGLVRHAVRFTKGDKGAVSLGALGSSDSGNTSGVSRANSFGAAVGWSTNRPADADSHAVLFVNGQVIELATQVPAQVRAKYRFFTAVDINDAGQITVRALRRDSGDPVSLRLDPQP